MADFPNHSPAVSTQSRNNDEEIPYASLHSTADRWKATAGLLRSKGDSHGAASAYAEAVSLNPGNADLHRDLGTALMEAGDRKGAIAALCEAVRLQPNVADSYVNLGVLHYEEGSLQEAIACEEQALALNPALGEACNNLGIALRASGRLAEAEDVLRKAIALDRGFGPAHYNLGCTLFDRWELDNAESAFREALVLMPGSPAVHTNLGHTLFRKGNNDSAIECYRKAIALQPDFVDAHWNLSHALLLRGDVTQGWAEFEWRWRKPEFRALRKSYPFPEWDGRSLPHSSLLVFAEQGYGDLFHFARYLPLLAKTGMRVVVDVPAEAADLVRHIPGVDRVVVRSEQPPAVDACCGLMSIPYLLGEPARSLPIQVPYLKVAAQKQKFWEQRFQASASTLRVGVVWSGSMTNPAGRYRSMLLQEILPLLETSGIQFYSLQKSTGSVSQDSGIPSSVVDWSDELHDFSDTAALIQQLDLVISMDTAVAHLAGALGKPVWVLLSRVPDWRWRAHAISTHLYPTMRLYRQQDFGRWDDVICRAKEDLEKVVVDRALRLARNSTGDHRDAIAAVKSALALQPSNLEILNLLGQLSYRAGNKDDAIAAYRQMAALFPEHVDAHAACAQLAFEQGEFSRAIELYRNALRISPSYPGARHNLGLAFESLWMLDEAEEVLREQDQMERNNPDTINALANILRKKGLYDEALAAYHYALRLSPDAHEIQSNLGLTYYEQGRLPEAVDAFHTALALDAERPLTQLNLAFALLASGDFREGWERFEWRRRISPLPISISPEKELPDLRVLRKGQAVLVCAEQGFGDTLQFVRYLPLLENMGIHVSLVCQPALRDLLQASGCCTEVVGYDQRIPEHDFFVPLLSIPRLLGTPAHGISGDVPYVFPDETLVGEWRHKLPTRKLKPWVGIAWAGSSTSSLDRVRSLPDAIIRELLAVPGIHFVNLQKDRTLLEFSPPAPTGSCSDSASQLHNFNDTAALVVSLDLVISADTAVAHLAGAMNKPVWTMVPYAADWRWMGNRDSTIWYPSMTLFRQSRPWDWKGVIERVKAALQQVSQQ